MSSRIISTAYLSLIPMTEEYFAAGVAVENTAFHFDKPYDYLIPESVSEYAKPGCRVMVSFGKGSVRQGMIISVHRVADKKGLKTISELLDREPVLTKELVELAVSMKDRCFCTLFDACKTMLPAGLSLRITYSYTLSDFAVRSFDGAASAEKAAQCSDTAAAENAVQLFDEAALTDTERQIIALLRQRKAPVRQDRILRSLGLAEDALLVKLYKKGILARTEVTKKRLQDASVKMVRIKNDDSRKYTDAQRAVLDVLRTVGDAAKKEICYFTGVSGAVVDNLVKRGVCEYYDAPPPAPEPEPVTEKPVELVLTDRQNEVYNELLEKYESGKPSVSLLYGITGSGKTSVFMKLIDRANEENRGVICMVPEIALTPQLLAKFNARYGGRVAVFHSGLSLSKRLEEWKKVRSGQANIAVGTRSAVFAPLENTGLIVIDEEQEYSYKSSSSPRYHARELAKLRCMSNNCLLLLSSATPSVESYHFAKTGRYSLHTLESRYGNAKLPQVRTVDMNREKQSGNTSDFSSELLEAIEENLKDGKQSIILLNRRGHNTFVSCRLCSEVISCPSCSISLTYHSANDRLMCHYCGYSIPAPTSCPKCGYDKLRYSGAGTQKAEQEIAEIFPEARILRLDTDSTMQRYSYEKKLGAFRRGEYDIMLGTQMVAKGLDFENVTLVGVLSADLMLHSDDFRSYERAFSLLTQVVGRSGRGEYEGRALIQTYEPENPIIEMAADQDYVRFFENEEVMRRTMLYPPFSDICVVAFTGEDRQRTQEASVWFSEHLSELARLEYSELPMRVLGPAPAMILRVCGRYRYRLIIKFRNTRRFREMLSRLLCEFGKNASFSEISAYADIDPDNII